MNGQKLPTPGGNDRRTKRRFPIEQEVRYQLDYSCRTAEAGTGRTVNISSAGISFTTEHPLSAGTPVEISINWPFLLDNSCPIKLMIYGNVVRSNDKLAAVAIQRYEFRTQGSRHLQKQSNQRRSAR